MTTSHVMTATWDQSFPVWNPNDFDDKPGLFARLRARHTKGSAALKNSAANLYDLTRNKIEELRQVEYKQEAKQAALLLGAWSKKHLPGMIKTSAASFGVGLGVRIGAQFALNALLTTVPGFAVTVGAGLIAGAAVGVVREVMTKPKEERNFLKAAFNGAKDSGLGFITGPFTGAVKAVADIAKKKVKNPEEKVSLWGSVARVGISLGFGLLGAFTGQKIQENGLLHKGAEFLIDKVLSPSSAHAAVIPAYELVERSGANGEVVVPSVQQASFPQGEPHIVVRDLNGQPVDQLNIIPNLAASPDIIPSDLGQPTVHQAFADASTVKTAAAHPVVPADQAAPAEQHAAPVEQQAPTDHQAQQHEAPAEVQLVELPKAYKGLMTKEEFNALPKNLQEWATDLGKSKKRNWGAYLTCLKEMAFELENHQTGKDHTKHARAILEHGLNKAYQEGLFHSQDPNVRRALAQMNSDSAYFIANGKGGSKNITMATFRAQLAVEFSGGPDSPKQNKFAANFVESIKAKRPEIYEVVEQKMALVRKHELAPV